MHYILPTKSFAIQLYAHSKDFTEKNDLEGLELKACVEIIITLVEEQVFNRLYWTDKNPAINLDVVLSKYLPWWAAMGESLASSDYYSLVIDDFEIRISELICEIVGEENTKKMWRIWYTQRLGDDLILESGIDYRIAELERTLLNESLEDTEYD